MDVVQAYVDDYMVPDATKSVAPGENQGMRRIAQRLRRTLGHPDAAGQDVAGLGSRLGLLRTVAPGWWLTTRGQIDKRPPREWPSWASEGPRAVP